MIPALDIWLTGRLPGLNEVILQNRRNKYAGAKLKKSTQTYLVAVLRGCPKLPGCYAWRFEWVEQNQRRNPDNIASAVKFLFDALQDAGIIENDGWQQVASIAHVFRVGNLPGVRIVATELQP